MRQFAKEEEEGQEVGQPEVVGGYGAISLREFVLIDVASSGGV